MMTTATSTYQVPQSYIDDAEIGVTLAYITKDDGTIPAGTSVHYEVRFTADDVVIAGNGLHVAAGKDATPEEMYRALLGFLSYYGDHHSSRHDGWCDGGPDCPTRDFSEAETSTLHYNAERLSAGEVQSELSDA